jgi:hypothetical protein
MRQMIRVLLLVGLLVGLLGAAPRPVETVEEAVPNNTGPVKLLTASWLGGPFDDEIVSTAITSDMSIVLAGNTVDLQFAGIKPVVIGPAGMFDKAAEAPSDPKKKKNWRHPSTHGFVVRLSPDGQKILSYTSFGYGVATIRKMCLDTQDNIFVLGNSSQGIDLGNGSSEKGTFVAALTPTGAKMTKLIRHPDASDFGVDGNGEVVVLTKGKMTRYAANGATHKWTVTWKSYGDNRAGGMALSPDTGVAVVTGYGMTHTGKEPYKDPYGYGFDRDGKQLWAIWNPDPKKEKDAKFSSDELKTNGLMADTTGHAASYGANGKIYFMLFADGGNSVCTRDPLDVDRPLDKNVFAGVFQNGPGFGFKGASKTSVVFRIDARKGTVEKGTWMCAWLTKSRANGLGIDAATCDEKGRQFLVGGSAFGCPTKDPWYVCKEGGYQGGGFLAAMDPDFKMVQCGYFPASGISSVSARAGTVVIGGNVKQYEDEEAKVKARVFKPLQKRFGGGDKDAYFAIFKIGK